MSDPRGVSWWFRRAPRTRAPRARARSLAGALLLASVAFGAPWVDGAAAEPVLHEYIDLGPGRDPIEPVVSGQYPEAAPGQLPSSAAPGSAAPGGAPSAGEGADAPEAELSPGSPFSIDRDTTRPSSVSYEDPFTPTIVPFKRGVVYDSVNRDGELVVRDAQLRPVPMAGALLPSDEHFHAQLELELRPGAPLGIPSVAPGARLVMAHPSPDARLSFARDSAENWYVSAERSGRYALALQIVADRRVFGSAYRDVGWSELGRELPVLPAPVKQSALEVARALGVAESARPRDAVQHLVEHFRRFRASARRPNGYGLALYREIALTARGICRHRAYAFMITALGLGIPTRMALNEAHAWVEVWDGELWHRIDLGGAASELEMSESGRPQHVQPRDPFAWPDPDESGNALAQRRSARAADASAARDPGGPPGGSPFGDDPEDDGTDGLDARDVPGAPLDPPLVVSHVTLARGDKSAERGKALFVSGRVAAGGKSCSGMSVGIELTAKASPVPLGTLISDARGNFAGRLIVPWSAPLGEHTLGARALGSCEP